jgi:2-polyprenyl-6-methoxyphenol hydroxylase-like FAD-dependent oxidoreductase
VIRSCSRLGRHRGFDVTVVERAPVLRKTGGHAVDLFRPVMDISEHMGVIDRVLEHATGTKRLLIYRSGASRPADIDYVKLLAAASDRHVEIMRDDLSEIYYEAGRNDIVVGADGLHSGVRRLAFGDVEASRPPPRRRARSIPVPPVAAPVQYDHRDLVAQKALLHNRFAGLAPTCWPARWSARAAITPRRSRPTSR